MALLPITAGDAAAQGKTFLYKELNFLAGLSTREERFDLAKRSPLNSVGIDYYHAFGNVEGNNFRLAYVNLHTNLAFDAQLDLFQIVFLDAYMRWKARDEDTFLLTGQFNIPFGMNPIQQPRGTLFMPLEALDLGFKKDWGLAFSSTLHDYWYKVALTMGMGTGLHTPDGSYLVSGRIGSPTYLDFEHGFSLLYGQVPTIRGVTVLDPTPIERWRMGLDFIYKFRKRITFLGEAAFGSDHDRNVWGLLGRATYFPRGFDKWQLTAAFQSWNRNAAMPRSHDTQVIAEAAVSATDKIFLRLHWIHDINRSGGPNDELVLFQIFFYGV